MAKRIAQGDSHLFFRFFDNILQFSLLFLLNSSLAYFQYLIGGFGGILTSPGSQTQNMQ